MMSLANSYLAGSVLLALVLFCQRGVLATLKEQGLWPWLCLCQILVNRALLGVWGLHSVRMKLLCNRKGNQPAH